MAAGRARGGVGLARWGPWEVRKCQVVPALYPVPGALGRIPDGQLLGERRGLLRAGTAMAPAASRLRAESEFGSLPRRALAQYLLLLKLYPVFTKAISRWVPTGRRSGKDGRR